MDLNVLVLSGRLGKDPEMRYTSNERAVCNFPLAVSLYGEDKTLWIDVTVWGKQAENSNKYLSKGSPVAVNGYLTEDSWETDDGQRRRKKYMVANNVQFLGSSKEKEQQPGTTKEEKVEEVDDLLDGAESLGDYDFPL